ncbi:hypothetical protein ACSFA8_23570 [Variovorax sp. RT4R15]|uniref:hypothetical protein n=1 Tax=Variovorax sp. RT4R15 TaxID=3443737 RepID=UPI003F46B106
MNGPARLPSALDVHLPVCSRAISGFVSCPGGSEDAAEVSGQTFNEMLAANEQISGV